MLKHKRIRDKGRAKLGDYFKEIKQGEKVAIIRDLSKPANFARRIQGKTGTILGKRGNFFIVGILDGNKKKKLILESSHLKKLKTS